MGFVLFSPTDVFQQMNIALFWCTYVLFFVCLM